MKENQNFKCFFLGTMIFFLQTYFKKNDADLLCCPLLKPHIIGVPSEPGEVIEKLSVTQSPKEEPGKNSMFNMVTNELCL